MDAYPVEFVAHLQPLLFVGGLDDAQYTETAFAPLITHLRKAFTPKRGLQIWDTARGGSTDFHVVLVDKNARFPPRKGSGPSSAHSPLSPLSPASPLYPDGLMAPIWIRKHREMIPCAFVLVLRLWEPAMDESLSHLDPLSPGASGQIEEREKQRDAELVTEILERKRLTAERGIKLAVVLLTSRAMLDDPNLDFRLSIIRRQSSLDARASLFVISPVAAGEVANFVASLRNELYEGAVDYYREHGRRSRRKRSRVPTQVPSRPIGTPSGPPPLGPQAWSVRYDYKMAVFAEMRQELEVALKHYEDCYDGLLDLFGAATALPPRTKRWLEAKVLADCTNAKICKFYLYGNEPDRVLVQHNKHVNRFRTLCQGWGIGENTFEYWSWLSKQHRLFADLLEIAVKAGFRLPEYEAQLPTKAGPPPKQGLVPATTLLHPGFYYYLAAQCAVERKLRFRTAQAAEHEEANGSADPKPLSRALEHERQVKHDDQIIELFTKAYDYFKRYKTGRLSLFVAAAIAGVHFEADNHDVAYRFFERIAKTYRKEEWRQILEYILHRSYVAARAQQNVPAAVKLAVEMLALGPESPDFAIEVQNGLQPILQSVPAPGDAVPIRVDEPGSAGLLDCHVAFWQPTALLDSRVAFQLVLAARPIMAARSLTFSSLRLRFANVEQDIVIEHAAATSSKNATIVELPREASTASADLSWTPRSRRVFSGSLSLTKPAEVQLENVTLLIGENGWTIEIPLKPGPDEEADLPWYVAEQDELRILPARGNRSCSFTPRTLSVEATTETPTPAFLGEHLPISVNIVNTDDQPVHVVCDLLLHPTENDGDVNTLVIDGEALTVVAQELDFGDLAAGERLHRVIHLRSAGSPGPRSLDVSIRAHPISSGGDEATETIRPLPSETLFNLVIPAVYPLHCAFDPRWQQGRTTKRKGKGMGDLSEPDGWEDATECLLGVRLGAFGPWPIEVLGLDLHCERVEHRVRKLDSTDDESMWPAMWEADDAFQVAYRLEVSPEPPDEGDEATGHIVIRWRRAGADGGDTALTLIPLPSLVAPFPQPQVTVRLPSYVTQHQLTPLYYTLHNPSLTRPLRASIHVEGGEPWAFAGPRRTAPFLVLPGQRYNFTLTVVATSGAGDVLLPIVRVVEYLPVIQTEPADIMAPSSSSSIDGTGLTDTTVSQGVTTAGATVGGARTRELPVLIEGGAPNRPLSVFVVPEGEGASSSGAQPVSQ